MLDPMSQLEEEMRLKEAAQLKELFETVVLDDFYFTGKDLSCKGRDIHPSGKQKKQVQQISQSIRVSNQLKKSTFGAAFSDEYQNDLFEDSSNMTDFNLNAKPRIFICSGFINRFEADKLLKKNSRRFLFLFNDVLLVTHKKDNSEYYDLLQLLWMKDMRIRSTDLAMETGEENLQFELLINKTRTRPKSTIVFACENRESKMNWVQDISTTLLAYHQDTEYSKQLGWFHDIYQGCIFSAAFLGDLVLLRRHLNQHVCNVMSEHYNSIDALDDSGMSALHWAVLKGHEVCARLLLDRGADVDVVQKGLNTPLLLAVAAGHDTVARLLLERGASMRKRNLKDFDALFMAVVYGHSSKGLPWILQLLNARGLDLNSAVDKSGATPLHLCAQKNLARPVRMLVDAGADVNAKHLVSQLTPLQMACGHAHPDMETIRSFLDKGAYPNWRDSKGRTAFEIAIQNQPTPGKSGGGSGAGVGVGGKNRDLSAVSIESNPIMFVHADLAATSTGSVTDDEAPSPSGHSISSLNPVLVTKGGGGGDGGASASSSRPQSDKWRAMEGTLEKVGDWAVKALPALLEITKKGGRIDPKGLVSMYCSF